MGSNSWFGILAGILVIVLGVYSLLQPGRVASWLESHMRPYVVPTATLIRIRQIKTLGVLFILAGGFFLAVGIRNY